MKKNLKVGDTAKFKFKLFPEAGELSGKVISIPKEGNTHAVQIKLVAPLVLKDTVIIYDGETVFVQKGEFV